jgi:hypothetical protein
VGTLPDGVADVNTVERCRLWDARSTLSTT